MTVAKGHVKIGAPGALRDYLLTDPRQFAATPANPMAAKIATGGGKYDDYVGWSFWVMEDWSAGASRQSDEVGNGYLFGDCASFMRQRLTLPFSCIPVGRIEQASLYRAFDVPFDLKGELGIGTTQTVKKVALELKLSLSGGTDVASGAWVYVFVDGVCSAVKMEFSRTANTVYAPGTAMYGDTVDLSALHPGGQWIYLDFGTDVTLDPATYNYWIAWYPAVAGETLYVPVGEYFDLATNHAIAYGTSWSGPPTFGGQAVTCYAMFNRLAGTLNYDPLVTAQVYGGWEIEPIADMVQRGINLYCYGGTRMYKLTAGGDPEDDVWEELSYSSGVAAVFDMHVWGDDIYVAHGTKLYKIDASDNESEVGTNLEAHVLTAWNGYLYRASGNELWYTGDGTTWEGPFEAGPPGEDITGLAGLGEYCYIATETGLYYLAPGDFVVGVAPWPVRSAANGLGMINHNGALYVPLRNRIWMFSESGTFNDVWLDQGADFPAEYLGEIVHLASTHLGLVASVRASDQATSPTLWLLSSEGWHCLAVLPPAMGAGKVRADSTLNRLWTATYQGWTYWLPFEPMAVIPVRNPLQMWAPYGWMETDWYSGGLLDVDKDWESVTVFGANLSSDGYVRVYYRDSETAAWRLLGTVTADNTELRWLQATYRPTSAKLKLGFLLTGKDRYTTPEVRAWRVKYMPMVTDRWRWQLPILVHDSQQMLDGSINSYTAAQQLAHLDSMVTRVAPLVLEDPTGVQYEVKVLGGSKQISEYEAIPAGSGTQRIKWVYTLSLEQVTA